MVPDCRQAVHIRAHVRARDGQPGDGRVRDVGVGEQGRHPHDGRDDAGNDVVHQRRRRHGTHSRRRSLGDELGGRESLAFGVGEGIERGSHRRRLHAQRVGDPRHLFIAQNRGALRDDAHRSSERVDVRAHEVDQRGCIHEHGPSAQRATLRGSLRDGWLGFFRPCVVPVLDAAQAPESFLERVAFFHELGFVPAERCCSLGELADDGSLGRVREFLGLPFLAPFA
mmetsp:Transcript_10728/g.49372  ORF Transcript_10728/g.49372 Transcript_10728/m.49372 type:complete len:226 (+) Transcript_10728:1809-2486(+)